MLNAFLAFSGYRIGEDGAPSPMVIEYCRTKRMNSKEIADLFVQVEKADRENEEIWKRS